MSDDPLSTLVYVSRSTFVGEWAEFMRQTEQILSSAHVFNKRLDVTGLLMVGRSCFAQIFEGSESAVEAVFERVLSDTRHEDVVVLTREALHERIFGDWTMAFVADRSGLLDRFVSSHSPENRMGAGNGLLMPLPPCEQLLHEVEYLAGDVARSRVSSILRSSPRPHSCEGAAALPVRGAAAPPPVSSGTARSPGTP